MPRTAKPTKAQLTVLRDAACGWGAWPSRYMLNKLKVRGWILPKAGDDGFSVVRLDVTRDGLAALEAAEKEKR